jgi:mannose-6-phosphate isomerase-like protein (cupin superfamily)
MAYTNQVIENKTFGDKLEFLTTAEDSKGELLKLKMTVKPGGDGPPEHYHPVQSECFEVISGELSLLCNGTKSIIKAGEKLTVPANAAHKWWNGSTKELVVAVELRPALKSEFFFETIYSLDVQGKTNKKGLPNLFQFAAILNECYGELFVVGPPIPAQKFMAKVIGGFAKLIGYKGYIPFPKK